MKMLRRIKLRALLFRRHYSSGRSHRSYHRLSDDGIDRDCECRHGSFFKSLSKKLSRMPLACIRASSSKGIPRDVHRGSFPVYVGPEQKRFVMKTRYLEHPVFGFLLQRSREEFGCDYEGGLLIPCPVAVFESLLSVMKQKKILSLENGELSRLIERCRNFNV